MKLPFVRVAISTFAAILVAHPARATFSEKHPTRMEKAVAISISPSGQKYFEENLGAILAGNGIAIDAGIYDKIDFTFDDFLKESAAKKKSPESDAFRKLLSKINLLTIGLDLKPSVPNIHINELMYYGDTRLSIRPDWAKMDANPGNGSVTLIASMEFSEFELSATQIRLKDQANPVLRTWGINEFAFSKVPNTNPFYLRIPVEIGVSAADRTIDVVAKSLETNIDTVEFQLPKKVQLLTPQVDLGVGSAKGRLDFSEISTFIDKHKNSLLKALQNSLKAFVDEKLASQMNHEVKQGYNPNDPEVDTMDPPGALNEKDEKYRFGIQLSGLTTTKDHLIIADLSANIDDPIRIKTPLPEARKGTADHAFDEDALNSDLSFAIKETLVNRTLQLSFLRGYFDNISIGDGETIKLVSAPAVILEQGKKSDLVALTIDANYEVKDFLTRSLAVRNPMHMRFKLNVQIKKTGNAVKLVQHSVDTSSLWINPNSLRNLGFKKKVRKTILQKLEAANRAWAETETLLSNEVMIPQSFYGIPLNLDHFKVSDGYIYLHFNLRD
ncbi:MAG: hypothetical protein JNL01_16880 [Bdellovibrionales bacterium]|nr:hypothetical protein [Bdellovibrionales bacterium]